MALSLLCSAPSAADDKLQWQAPTECPDRARVQAELARLITHAPRADNSSSPSVEIERVSESTLQARVSLRATDGLHEHILSDPNCETLTRAAALVVALAMDQTTPESGAATNTPREPPDGTSPVTRGGISRETTGGTSRAASRAASDGAPRAASDGAPRGMSGVLRETGDGASRAASDGAPRATSDGASRGMGGVLRETGDGASRGMGGGASRGMGGEARGMSGGASRELRGGGLRGSGDGGARRMGGDLGGADRLRDGGREERPQRDVVRFEVSLRPRAPERPVLLTREARVTPGEWERTAEAAGMQADAADEGSAPSSAAESVQSLRASARAGDREERDVQGVPPRGASIDDALQEVRSSDVDPVGGASRSPLQAADRLRRDHVAPAGLPSAAAHSGAVGVFVGAAAGLSRGIIPRLAPSFDLHAGFTRDLWCGTLRLGFAPAQSAQLVAAGPAGGSVALGSAALEGGVRLRAFGLEFPLLAGLESGVFLARGLGVAERSTEVSGWLAGYMSPGVSRTWAERFRGFLRLDGLVALRRPRFGLEGATGAERVFHQPDRLGARIYLGVDLILK